MDLLSYITTYYLFGKFDFRCEIWNWKHYGVPNIEGKKWQYWLCHQFWSKIFSTFKDFYVKSISPIFQGNQGDLIDNFVKKNNKIQFPFGSTQVRSIELAICSINWLLKSKGYPGLPLRLYEQNLEKHFHGNFIPNNLCQNVNEDQIEYLTC